MSYDIGLRACRCLPTERVAHTEYCSNDALIKSVTGRDVLTDADAWRAFYDAWDYDFIWATHDGPVDWSQHGRVTDMGHAEFLEGGRDRHEAQPCPFHAVEEVWAFDAVAEYGLPDFADLVAFYEQHHQTAQAGYPNQVHTGGYYKTLISGAIHSFGWEMLLLAAIDPDKFERVIEGFFQLTLHHVKAWAETSIEVFIQHDDFVWTQGPFMQPAFYRERLMPRYAALWRVLHEAGKTVLFCSDGTFTELVDDLFAAGADGLIFEPTTSLEYVVERYGGRKAIVGSLVDCRTLTFGTPEQIVTDIDRTLALAKDLPGFMFAVGNHIPSNVPVANGLAYMEHLRATSLRHVQEPA